MIVYRDITMDSPNDMAPDDKIALEKSISQFGYLDSIPAIFCDHIAREIKSYVKIQYL